MTTDKGKETRSLTYRQASQGASQISRATNGGRMVYHTIATTQTDKPVQGIIATSLGRSVSINRSTNK